MSPYSKPGPVASAAGFRLLRTVAVCVAAACLSAACAINPRIDLADLSQPDQELTLESVPFYAQTEYECGPAALAGVLGAAGVEITPAELSPQIYLPERKGSLQLELLAASRRAGRIPYTLEPEPSALIRELEAGRPVLVFQNLRTPHFPVWHFAVLTGFNARANEFYLNTGEFEFRKDSARSFLRTWDWADRWALVVLRPGELPSEPDLLRYLQAISDFEKVAGSTAAEPAWRKAVEQWPQDHRPYLALGNAEYRSGNYMEAVRLFDKGLEFKPDDAALENNLASALAEAGCAGLARNRLAAYLGGLDPASPWYQDLSHTLSELESLPETGSHPCAGLAGR